MLEPQAVGEQSGELALERVEARERVLPDGDQDVDGELRPHDELGQDVAQRSVASVVDEVLLDLVEQQVDLAVLGGGDLDRVGEGARLDRCSSRHGPGQRRCRSFGPGIADDDERFVGERSQLARHARAHNRALADARRAVEHGQPGSHDVGHDHVAIVLAPEEELLVELGVLERREPLVRARRRALLGQCRRTGAHAAVSVSDSAARRRCSSSSDSSAASSRISTPRWRHCSAVSRFGAASIAHDR